MDANENPLELDEDALGDLIDHARDRILEHISSLPDQPAANTENAAEIQDRLREPEPPESGTPIDTLLATLFDDAIPASLNTAHPGYLAYIPGGGLPHAAVADLISNAVNRYVGTWFAAPALARLEANVIEWFCRMVGYPEDAFGVLTTGGSMANQIAITTARREQLGEDFQHGTIYVSDQVHHSVSKSAVLAGFPASNVRSVSTDAEYRLDPDALRQAITSDRGKGFDPFLIVANAGSTNTGAVDPLPELATIGEEEALWVHADAAYGGFFVLTEEGSAQLEGMHRADSITLDPHKGLFLPYGTGSLLVRDGAALARAHAVSADYIPEHEPGSGLVDFSQLSPELSRDFRGLRVWLPLKMHGVGAFRQNLQEKLELAQWAAAQIDAMEAVRLVAKPQLSTLAFRAEPEGLQGDALDAFNEAWMERVNEHGRVHLSGTRLEDRFTLRISVLSFRTHRSALEDCIEDLRSTLAAMLPV